MLQIVNPGWGVGVKRAGILTVDAWGLLESS